MDRGLRGKLFAGLLLIFLAALFIMRGGMVTRVLAEASAPPTLVLDAGHGGFDGGAIGSAGTTEQDINLSIAQRVQALAGFFGVRTAMTRETNEALDYHPEKSVRDNKVTDIKAREQKVHETVNPVFLSIHLNKFSDAQYHGAQVFYSKNNARSKQLAELLQACLVAGADPSNHRQAKPAENTIYLMKKLDCPAVIVECGFLSNPAEEALLSQQDYHKKLAVCILCGYLRQANSV